MHLSIATTDERAADEARIRETEAVEDARAATKATRTTRTQVPQEFNTVLAACRNMLDCDRLLAAIEAGWSAEQINFFARQFGEIACHAPNKETPAAFRFALEFINGGTPGHFASWFPPEQADASAKGDC